jgi:MFS family permease
MSRQEREQQKIKKAHIREIRKDKLLRYWVVYLALLVTAGMSSFAGLALPFEDGVITLGRILAGLFYASGFIVTGEGVAYFWFGKLTDADADNKPQIRIAVLMLITSIASITATTLAAGSFIAYYLGVLSRFEVLPYWAQGWIVWAIPVLLVLHMVTGMTFRALSEEAKAERDMNARIRQTKDDIAEKMMDAKAEFWDVHAPTLARDLGRLEAREEIEKYSARLATKGKATKATTPEPPVAPGPEKNH